MQGLGGVVRRGGPLNVNQGRESCWEYKSWLTETWLHCWVAGAGGLTSPCLGLLTRRPRAVTEMRSVSNCLPWLLLLGVLPHLWGLGI